MQLVFALTLFTSAMLLFVVQPMFAKMVLPLLGGTPSVWNTCMVFYQAMLLAGYVYAHVTVRLFGPRRQAALHLLVCCLPCVVLPIMVAQNWTPPAHSNPVPWLLMLLAASVGLPFFVVSASAPMLQAWFADTNHPAAKDPYFLYAASNLGSMIALLGYPVLIEPGLRLARQTWAWTTGYSLLMLLVTGCAVLLWRSSGRGEAVSPNHDLAAGAPSVTAPTLSMRLRWLVLSFVPSSLLLGVTTHISTDVASVPLLWVVPLALYLLTFVLVFARRTLLPHRWMLRLQPYLVVLLAALFFQNAATTVGVLLALHLVTFFVTTMICHGELARERPHASRLTEFYIWMSVGGVLGGLFNVVLAPNLFATVLEYPLVIVLACMLRPAADPGSQTARARWLDFALPATVAAVLAGLVFALEAAGVVLAVAGAAVILAPVGLIAFGSEKRPIRFGLSVGAVLVVSLMVSGKENGLLHVERNFYGVVRVRHDRQLNTNVLVHGSTNHGMQSRNPAHSDRPLCYYHPTGPLGEVFTMLAETDAVREIGVIGLGTGSIATYGRPGQRITYYEIDPAVQRIAQDARFFTFLRDQQTELDIVLGDARLTLAAVPNAHYDLLILDAFSSDAIPVHLITREAVRLYLDKLDDRGLLALHISNRYL
ncbi:MAG: fused MFS/spermidine synthase, partial [Planctomycetes bacterium]|nr:fused MFS/spermidine synthase [Planctomycetota bacterium]